MRADEAIQAQRQDQRKHMRRPAVARTALTAVCLLALALPAGAQTPPPATPPAQDPAPADTPATPPPAAVTPAPAQVPAPPKPADGTTGQAPSAPGTRGQAGPVSPLPPTATPAPDGHGQTVFGGEGAVLSPVPVMSKGGQSSWEDGYDSIVSALNSIAGEMKRLGLTEAGEVMVVYTQSDDAGFEFEAQIPFSGATAAKPANGVKLGASFNGKALRFQHKGSFADMDDTYEQIANFLDTRSITALDNLYIEQYRTDPRTTSPDQLLVDILVPVR